MLLGVELGAEDGFEEPVGTSEAIGDGAMLGGSSIVAFWRLHAVCVRTRPEREDPVMNVTSVKTKRIPSRCAPAPTSTLPEICQKMFFASAPC